MPVDVETVRAIVRLHAWPATKAGYVRAMFWPDAPTLPLEAEISRAIPADLSGEVPTRMKDVLFGRYAFFDMANVAALEEKIRFLDGKLLWRQRARLHCTRTWAPVARVWLADLRARLRVLLRPLPRL